MRNSVVIERIIKAPIERVFDAFITPEDLLQWHHAGDGWKTPYAEVDPKVGGKIKIGYSSADGDMTFDFEAYIQEIQRPYKFYYRLGMVEMIKDDDRLVTIDLSEVDEGTKVRLELDLEPLHTPEQQLEGWTQHIDFLTELLEA